MTRELLPPELSRIFIFREDSLIASNAYTLFSEGKDYTVDVKAEPLCSGPEWTLTFIGRTSTVYAPLRTNCPSFEFYGDGGRGWGSVKEATWSVMGKSVVEDESGQTVGFVVSNLSSTSFRNARNEELAIARRYLDKETPKILGPGDIHLYERYVWDRLNLESFDERLLYCYVCILAISERSR